VDALISAVVLIGICSAAFGNNNQDEFYDSATGVWQLDSVFPLVVVTYMASFGLLFVPIACLVLLFNSVVEFVRPRQEH